MVCAAVALCATAAVVAGRPPVAHASINVTPYVTGSFTAHKREPAFLRDSGDDHGHISYRIAALKLHRPQRLPVYVIGDSLVRECLTTPGDLASRIQADSGVTTSVYDFGSSNQPFGESLAIVDNLPKPPGVVVISVSQNRFVWSSSLARNQVRGIRLLMPSTTLWRFILQTFGKAPRNSIAPGVTAYLADWRLRNAALLKAGKKPWHPYEMHRLGGMFSDDEKRELVAKWLTGRGRPGGAFDTWYDFNGRLLDRAVRRARARGFTVVLMEGSQNLDIVGATWDRYKAVYRPLCQQIAAADGAGYIDPNLTAGLVDADFRDAIHLVVSGRLKWMDALAGLLTPSVQALAPSPSPTAGSAP